MITNFNFQFQIFRKLSLLRLSNALLVYASYHVSRLTKRNFHLGSPISFAVEPTTACNLRCPECPSGLRSFTRSTGNLKSQPFRLLIDQLKKQTSFLTFYFQGEPYLNPEFLEMVEYASASGLITSTSTNAHFLSDEQAQKTVKSGLDRIIISIDGTDQKTYESYRIGGDLLKIIEGTKNLVKWKKKLKSKTPLVVFQFLVVKQNENQIDEIFKLGKELGVDKVVLKSAQIQDYKNGSEFIPDNIKYSRYKKHKDGSYSIKNKLLNQCWRMWSSCVITWNGDVVPCCFDKDARHKMGNVFLIPFISIWKGVELSHFRSAILKGRNQIDICNNCSEGTKVWL